MSVARLAVVGTKGMGRGHIKAINSLSNAELVAVCDVDSEEANACGGEFSIPCYTDLEQMFAKESLDGVSICTPHWFHPTIASKAFIVARYCRAVSSG